MEAFPDSRGGKTAYNLIRQIEAKEVERPGRARLDRPAADDPGPVPEHHEGPLPADPGRLGRPARRQPLPAGAADPAGPQRSSSPSEPDAEFGGRPAGDPRLRRADPGRAGAEGPQARVLLPLRQPRPEFQTPGQPDQRHRRLGVSDLAVVIRTEWGEPAVEGFVLKAKSGEPVAGADGQDLDPRQQQPPATPGRRSQTDKNGLFTVTDRPTANRRACVLLATHGGQELAAAARLLRLPRHDPPPAADRADGAVHRPVAVPAGADDPLQGHLPAGRPGDGQLRDAAEQGGDRRVPRRERPGGRQARRRRPTTTARSAGSFTAPRDRLDRPHDARRPATTCPAASAVSVEEYKRPQFQVELDAPKEPAKLGGEVKLTGKATAYTGAAVGGAKVRTG